VQTADIQAEVGGNRVVVLAEEAYELNAVEK
jgi:hypothetical protein